MALTSIVNHSKLAGDVVCGNGHEFNLTPPSIAVTYIRKSLLIKLRCNRAFMNIWKGEFALSVLLL